MKGKIILIDIEYEKIKDEAPQAELKWYWLFMNVLALHVRP